MYFHTSQFSVHVHFVSEFTIKKKGQREREREDNCEQQSCWTWLHLKVRFRKLRRSGGLFSLLSSFGFFARKGQSKFPVFVFLVMSFFATSLFDLLEFQWMIFVKGLTLINGCLAFWAVRSVSQNIILYMNQLTLIFFLSSYVCSLDFFLLSTVH